MSSWSRSEFDADAWRGFAEMFTAAHTMVAKADGVVDDAEVTLMFDLVNGRYPGAPAASLEVFDADPALAKEVMADTRTLAEAIAPDDGGGAAMRVQGHLTRWMEASPTEEVLKARGRLVRGLLVEVMYFGLRAGAADGSVDFDEYMTWINVGRAFGLPDMWLEKLRATTDM